MIYAVQILNVSKFDHVCDVTGIPTDLKKGKKSHITSEENIIKSWNLAFILLGVKLLSYLPHIHALSGCDSTSYMYGVGKVKPFRTLLKDSSYLPLLNSLGKKIKLENIDFDSIKKLIQCVCYNGPAMRHI